MTWSVTVVVGTTREGRYRLSRTEPTEIPLPLRLRCVASAVRTDVLGREHVELEFTSWPNRGVLTFEESAEPALIQFPRTEDDPLVTIAIGSLRPPGGGERLLLAA